MSNKIIIKTTALEQYNSVSSTISYIYYFNNFITMCIIKYIRFLQLQNNQTYINFCNDPKILNLLILSYPKYNKSQIYNELPNLWDVYRELNMISRWSK